MQSPPTDSSTQIPAVRAGRARTWPLFAAAFGSLFLTGMFQTVVFNRLHLLYREYDLTDATFGLIVAVITVLASLLGMTAIWLVPRWGLARTCLLGFAVFTVGLSGIVFAPWSGVAFLFGLVAAWGMSYLHLANGLAVQLAPGRGAQLTNLLHGSSSLGKAVGPTFAQLGDTWRTPFLGVAGLAAAVGLAGLFGRAPSSNRQAEETPAEEEAPAREATRQGFFWACAAVFIPIVAMEQLVTVWIAKYVQLHAGFSVERGEFLAWLVPSIILWTQCVGRFLAPVALLHVRPIRLLAVCALGSLGILLGTELSVWTGPMGLLGLLLCGIAFSVPYPTFFAIVCQFFPRHRGLLSIASGAATSLAFIVFAAVGGFLSFRVDPRWPLRLSPLLGLCLVLGALGVYWAGRKRRPSVRAAVVRREAQTAD